MSFNHYSAGAVIGFLRRYIDGICLGEEPAYRIFNVEPVFGGGLTATSVMHDLPYVRIQIVVADRGRDSAPRGRRAAGDDGNGGAVRPDL